jgi:hypothetical protein
MSDKLELFIGIIVLLLVFALTRRYHGWQIQRAYRLVVEDLNARGALSPETAVELPYSGHPLMRLGLRDHRRTALQHLILENIVARTPENKYYLSEKGI